MNRWLASGLLLLTSCALDPAVPADLPDDPPDDPAPVVPVVPVAVATPQTLPLPAVVTVPTRAACDALPELADPRNRISRGDSFELAGLALTDDRFRGGCSPSTGATGADVAVRFTPPSPGVWRLSLSDLRTPRQSYNSLSVSVHGACADGAPGAVQRCFQGASTLALALAEPVTVVVDGCHVDGPCRVTLRAERIDPSPAAPELLDARLFRAGEELALIGNARDADGDLRSVFVELLDADGRTVPQPYGPLLVGSWSYISERDGFRLPLGRPSSRVVRARVYVEDATARRSDVREVWAEEPPTVEPGAPCDFSGYTTTCGDAARCIYSRSTGHVCVARLEAHHDATARSIRVDLNPYQLGSEPVAFARVAFINAWGATVGQTEPFAWTAERVYSDQRVPLLSLDGWDAPSGMTRVRVSVTARSGAPLGTFEAPVLAPSTLRPFERCDPTTDTRSRCPEGYACGDTNYSSPSFQCRERVVACPGDMSPRQWAPQTDRAVVDGGPTGWFAARVSCLGATDSVWGAAVDFVAPRAATYRFTLTSPGAPGRSDFALSVRRFCALGGPRSESACASGTRAPTLTVVAGAGEHVPLIVSAPGPSLMYRVEVAAEGE